VQVNKNQDMKDLRQWINWDPIPKPEGGKPAKVPFCYKTNRKIDAQDPVNWSTYAEAKASNENVGFVYTENDPYFCVDLDNALVNGEWAPNVQTILNYFPSAYVEISYSNNGLHIIGQSGNIPAHRNKVKIDGFDVELYSQGRFIAFSEISSQGDYNHDYTNELSVFVNTYFAKDEQNTPVSLNERYGGYLKAVPEWLGSDDDNVLIEKMLESKQVIALLRGKVIFRDLWENNISALSGIFPDKYGTRAYDNSSADMALFSKLAWWTGNDGPRMERIARLSALVRPKWDNHVNYLSGPTGTIFNACKGNKKFYRDPKQVKELEAKTSDDPNIRFGPQFLDVDAQKNYFKGCVYILNQRKIFTPDAGTLKPDQFNDWYGGFIFAMAHEGKSTTNKAFDAFTLSRGHKFHKVYKSCFRPELESGEIIKINGKSYVNTYIPADITFGGGVVTLWLFLFRALFPDERDYKIIMCYMAACVQYPGVKFRWCPIIQGVEGNGKTILMECVAHAMGEEYTFIPQTHDLGNKFNAWMDGKLFIMVEELFTKDKQEIIEALKPLITNKRIPIQPKGVDTIKIDNRANFIMATNHRNAMKKTKKDRRYCVIYCPQQEAEDLIRDGLTEAFFKKLGNWLDYEGGWDDVAGYLKRFPIDDASNPATSSLRAPETTSTAEAIEESQGAAHDEIREAIAQGLPGFCGGWISSYALTTLLEGKNLIRYFPLRKRREILKDLGYISAPWLKDGRASKKIVSEENTQPILFVLENMGYGDVLTTEDYIKAQSPLDPVPMEQKGSVSSTQV